METICPNGHRVEVSPTQAGTEIHCPICNQAFTVTPSGGTSTTSSSPVVGAATSGSTLGGGTRPAHRARDWRSFTDRWRFNLLDELRHVVEFLLLLGLVIALTSRGCDSVGDRYVASSLAKAEHAEIEWNDEWEERVERIAAEEETLRGRTDLTTSERDRLDELRSRRQRIEDERADDRRAHAVHWNELRRDAREAAAQHRMAGVWYQAMFLLGTILFSIGLLVVGFTADGPSRWIALALLAIILFSVFVTGDPWSNVPPDLPATMRSGSR